MNEPTHPPKNASDHDVFSSAACDVQTAILRKRAALKRRITREMKKARKEPNWYGPEFEPVFYHSEEENEGNLNWCPEDDYEECKFELPGTVSAAIKRI